MQAPNTLSPEEQFEVFDLDHDGRLSIEELIVSYHGTNSQISCLSKTTLKSADKDGDQAINMDEFEVFNQEGKVVILHFGKHIMKTIIFQ